MNMLMRFLIVLSTYWVSCEAGWCNIDCSHLSDSGPVYNRCTEESFTFSANCCWNGSTVVGLDLRGCGIKDIIDKTFRGDSDLKDKLKSILWIDLSDNPVTDNRTHDEAFRNMTSLQYLSLPLATYRACVGTDDAWWNRTETSDARICENQRDFCIFKNILCPDSSSCVCDGPGLIMCVCDTGYYGYKCLKYGHFPFLTFYLTLGITTLALSVFFWCTQRRHVKQS